jgi:quercetin dioxygenase-like cupin family protein
MEATLYPGWKELVAFSAEGPQPHVLMETERLKIVVAGLLPGQSIPPHPAALGMYHFLEGNGWMMVDGERLAVDAGATVIVPDGAARGIEAETQLCFLATRVAS